ncbi:MAG: hypothetical protein EXR86_15810 [Gammaproteobacteria bacterium]|nr:hypothetical protein [Gammaproteobacteria bacterium]
MRAVKGISMLVGIIVALLLGAESYLRFVLKEVPAPFKNNFAESFAKLMEFDPTIGNRYRINIDQAIESPTGDFTILYKTNEINLRDRAMGTHLRQELKFLVFGDEFAEGWGSDIDRAFAVQAHNQVNEKTALNPPIRTVIAAQSGFGAAQNYLVGKKLFETIQPKAAIFFYTSLMPHADSQFLRDAVVENGVASGLKSNVAQTPRLPHLEDHVAVPANFLSRLALVSVLAYRAAEMLAMRAANADLKIGDPVTDRLAGMRGTAAGLEAAHAASLRHVGELAALAQAKQIPFLLVHLPLPPQISAQDWAGGRRLFEVEEGLQPSNDVAVVESFCTQHKIRCISLHNPMHEAGEHSSLFFANELALSLEGSNWVGSWLAEEILRWMLELGYRH